MESITDQPPVVAFYQEGNDILQIKRMDFLNDTRCFSTYPQVRITNEPILAKLWFDDPD